MSDPDERTLGVQDSRQLTAHRRREHRRSGGPGRGLGRDCTPELIEKAREDLESMAPPLSRGTRPEAGLDADEIGRIVPELTAALDTAAGPAWCAGAVVLAGRGPRRRAARGARLGGPLRGVRRAGRPRGGALPAGQRVPMRPGTVFDLASLSQGLHRDLRPSSR